MMLQLRSMLGNILCWKSIAETCGLLQHKRLKRSSMLLLRINKLVELGFPVPVLRQAYTKMIRAQLET